MKDELQEACIKVLDIVQSYCMERRGNRIESEVFFNKLCADMIRYQCEVVKPGPELKELKDKAKEYYERGERKSVKLHYFNPTKMGLGLSYANFAFEFLNNTQLAIRLAETTMANAVAQINACNEEEYHEASHIIELLRENIAIWKGDDPTKVIHGEF